MVFGLVAPGYQMARTAAGHLCGQDAQPFTGADMSTKLKLLGVDVGSIGDAHARTPARSAIAISTKPAPAIGAWLFPATASACWARVLVGDNRYYDTLLQYAQNGIAPPADPASLILPRGQKARRRWGRTPCPPRP